MTNAPPVASPADHATQGDYMAAEKARYAAKEAPQAAPIYPLSPADVKAAAVRLAQLDARVPPTLPVVEVPGVAAQALPDLTPVELLQEYPQRVNAEYLTPMTERINTALETGDYSGVYSYAESINPEVGRGLAYRAALAEGGEAVTAPASVTGAAGTNNSPADGATANTATFTVLNSLGQAMPNIGVALATTGAATLASPSGTTDASGVATASLTDATAETVTVTCTAGSVSGSADLTFGAAATLTTITGTNAADAAADGVAAGAVSFVALDAGGAPMPGVALDFTSGSGTALLDVASGTTDAAGAAVVNVTNTVVETVTVTATSGAVTGSATASFV